MTDASARAQTGSLRNGAEAHQNGDFHQQLGLARSDELHRLVGGHLAVGNIDL
jgi:hypothetical protein